MEQLLGDRCHLPVLGVQNGIVPLHEAALYPPALAVQGKRRSQEGEFLADGADALFADVQVKLGQERKYLLLHGGDVLPHGIEDVQAVSPRQLALHRKGHCAAVVHVIDVVAVKPGKHPLLEIELHIGKTSCSCFLYFTLSLL